MEEYKVKGSYKEMERGVIVVGDAERSGRTQILSGRMRESTPTWV